MTDQVFISGRRHGKTFSAAQRAGVSMDEYREMMRRQHETIASQLLPTPTVDTRPFFRTLYDERVPELWRVEQAWWNEISRIGPDDFMREYHCEFISEPELVGPPAPTFEQWQRNQERNWREASRRDRFRFTWAGI